MVVFMSCPENGCTFAGPEDEVEHHKEAMDKHDLHASQISDNPQPFCIGCYKIPSEIDEYLPASTNPDNPSKGLHPDEYVKREEGTYNPKNGHFLCTACYVAVGMPTSPRGWKAP